MPSATTATPPLPHVCAQIDDMVQAAMQFVAPDRGIQLSSKWLPRGDMPNDLPERRLLAMAADAMLLSADLLISLPAGSGKTAVDRLARSRTFQTEVDRASLEALRRARFRLLELEHEPESGEVIARDVMSAERLRVVGADLPPLPTGTALFGRIASVGEGLGHPAGAFTPLDPAAFAVARAHPAAGAQGLAASRWAEAVYVHVVRHGTLDVPGLNRPQAFLDDDYLDDEESPPDFADNPVVQLVLAWAALDGPPDAELLQRTRQSTSQHFILEALNGLAVTQRRSGSAQIAAALEAILLVQMEALQRRERNGSDRLTLDAIAHAIDQAIEEDESNVQMRTAFQSLRQRLAPPTPSAQQPGDPALAQLMQRIQALRAKTVERGCTEPEAMAAAAKVAELLDRHGLSLSELEFEAQPCEGIGIATTRRRAAPIDSCIPAIAAFFDCKVWLEHAAGAPLRYVFFGLRGDVAAARYLYELVERAFATETAAFKAGALYHDMAGERRTATTSFQSGMARGICAKLKSLQTARAATQRSASGRDLVPVKAAMVDAEIAKLGLDLRSRTVSRSKLVSPDAYAAGEAAGERFEVISGIGE